MNNLAKESKGLDSSLSCAIERAAQILVLANSIEPSNSALIALPKHKTQWCVGADKKNLFSVSLNDSGISQKDLIIVTDCDAAILYEALLRAKPMAEIAVVGKLNGIIENIDFYSTIHYKNLSLTFHPFQ